MRGQIEQMKDFLFEHFDAIGIAVIIIALVSQVGALCHKVEESRDRSVAFIEKQQYLYEQQVEELDTRLEAYAREGYRFVVDGNEITLKADGTAPLSGEEAIDYAIVTDEEKKVVYFTIRPVEKNYYDEGTSRSTTYIPIFTPFFN